MHGLALGQHPDVSGNAGIVEQVGGQLHNGFHKIPVDEVAADFRRTTAGIAGKQRGAVLDNGHAAGAVLQLFHAVEHKQHLSIRNGGQAGAEPTIIAEFRFGFHLRFLAFPVNTEGRVGDDIIELVAAERIIAQGVAVFHARSVAALDEHICLSDGVGFGIELLPEAGQSGIAAHILQPLGQAAQHLRSAHCHIIGRLGAALGSDFLLFGGDEQLGHQVNNVPAGEVGTSLLVVGFGEFADQLFKNVAHVGGGNFLRGHIALAGIELLQGDVEDTALDHQLDRVGKVEVLNDVLDIGGKALKIGFKVALHVVRLCHQPCKIEVAGVVEVVAGNAAEDAVTRSTLDVLRIQLLCHGDHSILGGLQGIVKTLQNCHGKNDLAVLVGLEQAHQMGGDLPDQVSLCTDVGIRLLL